MSDKRSSAVIVVALISLIAMPSLGQPRLANEQQDKATIHSLLLGKEVDQRFCVPYRISCAEALRVLQSDEFSIVSPIQNYASRTEMYRSRAMTACRMASQVEIDGGNFGSDAFTESGTIGPLMPFGPFRLYKLPSTASDKGVVIDATGYRFPDQSAPVTASRLILVDPKGCRLTTLVSTGSFDHGSGNEKPDVRWAGIIRFRGEYYGSAIERCSSCKSVHVKFAQLPPTRINPSRGNAFVTAFSTRQGD